MNKTREKNNGYFASLMLAVSAKPSGKNRKNIAATLNTPSVFESAEQRRKAIDESLPAKEANPRIAIFGSVDFYHTDSPALCDAIGKSLAQNIPHACVLTGANAVTQERISRAFHEQYLVDSGFSSRLIYHLSPAGYDCDWGFGHCLEAGKNMEERRFMLATLADICVVVEGGPGTVDEMEKAKQAGKLIIPISRTGGASSGMFGAPNISRPYFADASIWELLRNNKTSIMDTAKAVVAIVEAALKEGLSKKEILDKPRIESMKRATANALDVTYKGPPDIADNVPTYLEPTLAGCAHEVFVGKDHVTSCAGQTVLGNIYLGSKSAAAPESETNLRELEIGAIVNCTTTEPCCYSDWIKYCTVAVNDEATADILSFLDGATTFLHFFLNKGFNILVHCQMGISRSSTVVIAYLIRFWNMTRDEGFFHVKSRRPQASPNPGFWNQLQAFEGLCRERSSHNEDAISAGSETATIDILWAKQCNALYATCHETPELLDGCELFVRSAKSKSNQEHVLSVCLDYIWGRGLIAIDLSWLKYVCDTLDHVATQEPCSTLVVGNILKNKNSCFWNIWCGEIYESQIQKVLETLEQQKNLKKYAVISDTDTN